MAALLDAAASVIAEVGYNAATMTAIAERADASIGSLYQFYPSKLAVSHALQLRYEHLFDSVWVPIEAELPELSLESFVQQLVDSTVKFFIAHSDFLFLLESLPSATLSSPRKILQRRFAGFLLAKRPHLPRCQVLQISTVTLQVLCALTHLYMENPPRHKRMLIQEFKIILLCYLTERIGPDQVRPQRCETQ